MSDNKTAPNQKSVKAFLNSVGDEQKRKDSLEILRIMQDVTGEKPRMWGDSIVGFGSYHYAYASGREGDWFLTGFSPRRQNISIYILPELDAHTELLKRLGKHKTGKCCLYIKGLADIDRSVLRSLIRRSLTQLEKMYG